ncbi:MAG TPA: methyl-accepting chemotaxis protein, partial [Candidatus Competibacter sp.]|nr:methyl-accepting chemotaxis protein [Candidatus Competibacter sp.]
MFSKLKLHAQLNIGFATILVLLIVVSGTAYWGLKGALEDFTEYRRIVRMGKEVNEFQEQMLNGRLAVRAFMAKESEQAVQNYQKRLEALRAGVDQLQGQINNPERVKLLDSIKQRVVQYDESFKQLVALTQQRREKVDRLSETGAVLRKTMSEIIELSAKSNDTEQAILAGKLQEQVLLGRLYMVKFLDSHEAKDYERALDELKTKAQEVADALWKKAAGSEIRALQERFKTLHGEYLTAMQIVRDLVVQTDEQESTQDKIGLTVASTTEELVGSYGKTQDEIGSRVQHETELSVTLVEWLSGGAVLLGILLSWLLVRVIRRPIGGEPAEMAALTQQIAHGDLTVQFANTGRETGIYAAMRDMAGQ